MNVRNLSSLLLSLLTMVVLGCGGGGSDTPAEPDAPPATLTLSSSTATPLINTSVIITANVRTAAGSPVKSGTDVTFTAPGGTLSAITKTNASGDATVSLSSTTAGTVTVTATVGSLPPKTLVVTFTDPNSPLSVALTGANTVNINTSVTLTATLTPAGPTGVIADGTVVTFTASAGIVSAVTTTTNGVATATLSGITAPQTVSITAAAGNVTSPEINVDFINPNAVTKIDVIDIPGGDHLINNPVTISANVTRVAGGAPVPVGTPVNFAVTSGNGTLSPVSSATDASGNASVTLNSTVAGSVIVTATADSATGSHSVSFISQPTQVTVKVRTTGTLPAGTSIGGVEAIVSASPSSGLIIVADPNGSSTDIAASGAGLGSQIISNSNNVAAVRLALINTGGIQTGEFATLNYNVLAGSFPKASDFSIALTGAGVINTSSINIPGIGVEILSVTIQ